MKILNILKITGISLLVVAVPLGGIASYNILIKAKNNSNGNGTNDKYKPLSPFAKEFQINPKEFTENIDDILKNFDPSSNNEITSEKELINFIKIKLDAEHGVYKSFKQGDGWNSKDKTGKEIKVSQKQIIKLISNKSELTEEEFQTFKLLGISQSYVSYMYYKTIYDYLQYKEFQNNPKYKDIEKIEIANKKDFDDIIIFYKSLVSILTNLQQLETYLKSKEWEKAITLDGENKMSQENKNYIQNLPLFFKSFTKLDWVSDIIKANQLFHKLSDYATKNKLPLDVSLPDDEQNNSSIFFNLKFIELSFDNYNLSKMSDPITNTIFLNWIKEQVVNSFENIYFEVWDDKNFENWNYDLYGTTLSGNSLKQNIDPFGDRNNMPQIEKDYKIEVKKKNEKDVEILISSNENSYYLNNNISFILKNDNSAKEWNANKKIKWKNKQLIE